MSALEQVRERFERIRHKSNSPMVDRLLDEVEQICSAYMEPDQGGNQLPDGVRSRLTPTEARFFELLKKRSGHTVSRGALMDVAVHRADGEPDEDIIAVQICKLRRKLVGSRYKIETVWGTGYRLDECRVGDGGATYSKMAAAKSNHKPESIAA